MRVTQDESDESGVMVELSEEKEQRGIAPVDVYKVNRDTPSSDATHSLVMTH